MAIRLLRSSVALLLDVLLVTGGVAAVAVALPNPSSRSMILRTTSATSSCQQAPVTVSYSELPQGVGAKGVAVTLNDLDTSGTACRGKAVRVALLTVRDANRPVIDTGTVPATGSTMSLPFPSVRPADVVGVNVAFSG